MSHTFTIIGLKELKLKLNLIAELKLKLISEMRCMIFDNTVFEMKGLPNLVLHDLHTICDLQ